jgi:DNA polymerase-3 subunit epsilon
MREISLDTETTGLNPSDGHRIVEIGCVEMINRVRTGKTYQAYLNPQRDMPEKALSIHGLSEEFLKDKPLFEDIADEFLEFIGDSPLVIHNASFDMRFINFELKWIKREVVPFERAIDTLTIARKKFPGAPASLDALCRRYEIDISRRTKHGALLDAEMLADMYRELMGGGQEAMNLNSGAQKKNIKSEINTNKILTKRPHSATVEELELHQQFVEKEVKDPLWAKLEKNNG